MNKLKFFLSVISVLFFSLNAYAEDVTGAEKINIKNTAELMTECYSKTGKIVQIVTPGWHMQDISCSANTVTVKWKKDLGKISWIKKALAVSKMNFKYDLSDYDTITAYVGLGDINTVEVIPEFSSEELAATIKDLNSALNINFEIDAQNLKKNDHIEFKIVSEYDPLIWKDVLAKFSGLFISDIEYNIDQNAWKYNGGIYVTDIDIRKDTYKDGSLEQEIKGNQIINEKNPNMQYAKKCNIAAHINNLSKEMNGNPKAFYGDNASSILSNYTPINKKKVHELLSQNNKCSGNLTNLGWTMKCEKSERKYSSHYNYYYDQNCLNLRHSQKLDALSECMRKALLLYGSYPKESVMAQHVCNENFIKADELCRRREKVEDEYDTCEGDKKLILENGYNDIVFMVDSFKQPDLNDIDYISAVQALLKKYGPARSSKRKITKDDEKYEIFYWLDGGWVIQVEVKVDDFTDTSKVYSLDTYYMNYPNCIAQAKYEQEEE